MVTSRGLKSLRTELQNAVTAHDYNKVAERCDKYAAPLLLQKECIEIKLADLQSVRVKADTGHS